MKHYELLTIVPATYTEEELIPIEEKIKALIQQNGGQVTMIDNLGKKKLAYPIKKIRQGYYLLVRFDLAPEQTKKLEAELGLTTAVIRHTIVANPVAAPRTALPKPRFQPAASIERKTAPPVTAEQKEDDKDKIKLEDLDKKLDEILEGNIM
jgi:small subunit ribosomal protein S6